MSNGYLVMRRGLLRSEPWKPGQEVESYELLEPLPTPVPPNPSNAQPWDAHAYAESMAPFVRQSIESGATRLQAKHRCTCRSAPTIAAETVDTSGHVWVLIYRGESVPPAFRRQDHTSAPVAWPLHREPNGWAHVDLTTCHRCRQVWCVALTEREAKLVPVRATYGGRVAD